MSWSRLKRFFQANWKRIITALGFFFRPVIERFVLSVFPSFSEVKLLMPILWFLLFAAAAIGVTGVVVFVIVPALMRVADWIFRPAVVGSKRRRFYDLLPEVKWCLDALRKDYEVEASAVSNIVDLIPPSFSSHARYEELKIRLRMLFSRFEKLGISVPDSVEIDSLGDLKCMGRYLRELKACMFACDLDEARKIDPP